MRALCITLVVAAANVVGQATVLAQTPACNSLGGAKQRTAGQLLSSEYLYDCCDDTIARCLEQQPTCALAVRLADNICRRVAAGQDATRIRRSLSRRARSMVGGGEPATIDLDGAPAAGSADAPVTVVVYACARCPYCSKLVPALYGRITAGNLRGSAQLVFRTFPIRGHEGSTEAGLAFTAATTMGRFWEFLHQAYGHFDEFSPQGLPKWAAAAGLDPEAFTRLMADGATRQALVTSKKEGLANGVEETPTLFINGRRWVGDLEVDEVVDAIEEAAARIRGEQWVE